VRNLFCFYLIFWGIKVYCQHFTQSCNKSLSHLGETSENKSQRLHNDSQELTLWALVSSKYREEIKNYSRNLGEEMYCYVVFLCYELSKFQRTDLIVALFLFAYLQAKRNKIKFNLNRKMLT
jgi:hypothetical protein